MSFEKRMGYKPYKFKFDEAIYLAVKSKEEVERINETLKEESPESDYESYSWYLTAEIADKLKSQKLKIDMPNLLAYRVTFLQSSKNWNT